MTAPRAAAAGSARVVPEIWPRRCLQGMIRDFWGISKRILFDEIQELKGKVTGSSWDAIDAIREIGNVGAHMEKDVNIVIDVEPEEAGPTPATNRELGRGLVRRST